MVSTYACVVGRWCWMDRHSSAYSRKVTRPAFGSTCVPLTMAAVCASSHACASALVLKCRSCCFPSASRYRGRHRPFGCLVMVPATSAPPRKLYWCGSLSARACRRQRGGGRGDSSPARGQRRRPCGAGALAASTYHRAAEVAACPGAADGRRRELQSRDRGSDGPVGCGGEPLAAPV